VVDAVSDVLSIKQNDMKKAPSLGSKIKTDYILGMVSGEQGMIMLVDSEKLVDKEQLEVPES
ncbi:MAG: chemotaxis protein CheW, partial [Thiotrichaceae bacterium]|nr:chemotaxis protein CheW [Thiotrichaceae bacterium]